MRLTKKHFKFLTDLCISDMIAGKPYTKFRILHVQLVKWPKDWPTMTTNKEICSVGTWKLLQWLHDKGHSPVTPKEVRDMMYAVDKQYQRLEQGEGYLFQRRGEKKDG